MFFWRDIFQIVKTSSLQRMPRSLERITAYINETEFEAFYAILYVLKVFFNILLHSFQTEIAVLQRECTKSGRTLFMGYHVFFFFNTTWINRCWVIVANKCWTHILSALCLLYFGSIVAAFFEKCQTLQKARWNTKLLSEHLILSQFGEKKAGTKCRSHEVEGSDLD